MIWCSVFYWWTSCQIMSCPPQKLLVLPVTCRIKSEVVSLFLWPFTMWKQTFQKKIANVIPTHFRKFGRYKGWQPFYVKGQIVNTFVFVTTTQLCHCSTESATDMTIQNKHVCLCSNKTIDKSVSRSDLVCGPQFAEPWYGE